MKFETSKKNYTGSDSAESWHTVSSSIATFSCSGKWEVAGSGAFENKTQEI